MYDDYTTIVKTLCGDTAPGTVVIAGKMLARRENDELKLKSTIARYMGTRESGNRIIGMLLNRIPMRFYELKRVVRKYVTEHYREKAERTAQEQRAEIRRQDKMRLRRSEDDESGDEDAQFHECRPVDEEQTKLGKAIEDLQRHSQRVNSEISKLRNSLDSCSNSNRDMRKDVEALCSKITSLTQTTSSCGARVEAQAHIVTDVKALQGQPASVVLANNGVSPNFGENAIITVGAVAAIIAQLLRVRLGIVVLLTRNVWLT